MQVRSEPGLAAQGGTPWPAWITSGIFSLVVLAGYRVLEQREFLSALGILALMHVVTVAVRAPRLSWHLFLSQSLVVASTLASVFLHTRHAVGQVPPGWSNTLGSFLQAALSSTSTYVYFAAYVVAFCVVLLVVLLAIRASGLRSTIDAEVALMAAYAMSAANVAFDYSLFRPLYHVSGEPDALSFFFTAGLFGVESSLPLHVLLLAACLWWHQLVKRHAPVRRCGRESRVPTGGTAPRVLTLLAVLTGLSCLACGSAKSAPGSYFSSLDYQARETLSQSLFREDLSLLSNEEIERILSSKIELPRDARLALLQVGADPHVLVLPAPDVDGEGDALGAVLKRLAASDRLSSVVLLPSLLVPRTLSVAKLREAAARFQADLLFIYRTPCQQFRRNRFLSPDEAKAYCVAEGVLLDVRTGIVPFSSVASSTFGAVQEADDLTSYETLRRSQSEAIARAVSDLSDELMSFLAAAP